MAGRQQAVFVPQHPRVQRVGLSLQGEDVLEGGGSAGPAVGVPHGEGDGAGPGVPRAPAAGQVLAHGPLEVPHEERVDDGVHGAVAVAEPGEHVEEAGGDAAADCLAGAHSKRQRRPPPGAKPRWFPFEGTFQSPFEGFFRAVAPWGNRVFAPRGFPARPAGAYSRTQPDSKRKAFENPTPPPRKCLPVSRW